MAFEALGKIETSPDYEFIMTGFRHFIRQSYKNAPGAKGTIKSILNACTVKIPRSVYKTTVEVKGLGFLCCLLGVFLFEMILLGIFKQSSGKEISGYECLPNSQNIREL